jgi:hypothetical protein
MKTGVSGKKTSLSGVNWAVQLSENRYSEGKHGLGPRAVCADSYSFYSKSSCPEPEKYI